MLLPIQILLTVAHFKCLHSSTNHYVFFTFKFTLITVDQFIENIARVRLGTSKTGSTAFFILLPLGRSSAERQLISVLGVKVYDILPKDETYLEDNVGLLP